MKKTVYILGAGATRGCSFVDELKRSGRCLPPLDGDFFTQLQRVANRTHRKRIDGLIRGLADWFGQNYGLGMEQVFCHLEHAEKMMELLGRDRSADARKLKKLKKELKQAIATILGESLTRTRRGGIGSYDLKLCKWHGRLVKHLTNPGDTFITFNYDCVIDEALRRFGSSKWNPLYGYGFKFGPNDVGLSGYKYWRPRSRQLAGKDTTIEVHKVHGSLHFKEFKNDSVVLKHRPYGNPTGGDMHFEIIPPESSKSYRDGRFGVIMANAYKSLQAATRIVVIGYSLPPSDQHAEALFRFGVKKSNLDSLVVVNPDRDARRRVRGALSRGLKPQTRVLSFDSIEEFVNAEPSIWKI